jgi:membrane-bound inhibitor of C-type lysozyme
VDASDGAKYAFGDTSFWRQDKQAKVAQKEATLLTCQQK